MKCGCYIRKAIRKKVLIFQVKLKKYQKKMLTSLVKFDILNRQLEKKIARSLKTEQNVKTFEVRKKE